MVAGPGVEPGVAEVMTSAADQPAPASVVANYKTLKMSRLLFRVSNTGLMSEGGNHNK